MVHGSRFTVESHYFTKKQQTNVHNAPTGTTFLSFCSLLSSRYMAGE